MGAAIPVTGRGGRKGALTLPVFALTGGLYWPGRRPLLCLRHKLFQ